MMKYQMISYLASASGLTKEYTLEEHTTDETKQALEGLTADVTECTVKGLVANEAEREMMGIGAAMIQYAAMELNC